MRLIICSSVGEQDWFRSICTVHELSTGDFNFFFACGYQIFFLHPFSLHNCTTIYSTPSFEVGRAYSTTINLFSVHLFNHDLSRIFVEKIRRMPGSASPVKMTDFSLENPPRPLLRLPRTWSSGKVLPV